MAVPVDTEGPVGDLLPFDIALPTTGDCHVVRLRGKLDHAYADPVRSVLVAIAGSEVKVDLSGLTFLDAAGLSALLTARREILDRGHRIVLRAACRPVRRSVGSSISPA